MTEIENTLRDGLEETDEDYDIIELSVNRGTVDLKLQTELEVQELKDLIENEISDKTIIGLDVQKNAMEDIDGLVKHVNFKYRD